MKNILAINIDNIESFNLGQAWSKFCRKLLESEGDLQLHTSSQSLVQVDHRFIVDPNKRCWRRLGSTKEYSFKDTQDFLGMIAVVHDNRNHPSSTQSGRFLKNSELLDNLPEGDLKEFVRVALDSVEVREVVLHHNNNLLVNDKFIVDPETKRWRTAGRWKFYHYSTPLEFLEKYVGLPLR